MQGLQYVCLVFGPDSFLFFSICSTYSIALYTVHCTVTPFCCFCTAYRNGKPGPDIVAVHCVQLQHVVVAVQEWQRLVRTWARCCSCTLCTVQLHYVASESVHAHYVQFRYIVVVAVHYGQLQHVVAAVQCVQLRHVFVVV